MKINTILFKNNQSGNRIFLLRYFYMKRLFILTINLGVLIVACTRPQKSNDLVFGRYGVGLKIVDTVDNSRSFHIQQNKDTNVKPIPRPVRIYIWYPARSRNTSGFLTGENYFDCMAKDRGFKSGNKTVRIDSIISTYPPFRRTPSDIIKRIRMLKARASFRSQPLKGPFPMVVFGQGWGYESPTVNFILCEFLASHGYIVSAPLFIGKESYETHVDLNDLEAETADMNFVIKYMENYPIVDSRKIGVIGFDLGGMASMLLQIQNPDVRAMISLHSGIMFEHNTKLLAESPIYDPSRLWVPLLHFTNVKKELEQAGVFEDTNLIKMSRQVDRYIIRLYNNHHIDFTSLSYLGIYDGTAMNDYLNWHHETNYFIIANTSLCFLNSILTNNKRDKRKMDSKSFLYPSLYKYYTFSHLGIGK
jgi:hypothetical protein